MYWKMSSARSFSQYTTAARNFKDTYSTHLNSAEMENLLATDKVRAIRVAKYLNSQLTETIETCKIVPAVNQTEDRPLLPQKKLKAFCVRSNEESEALCMKIPS